MNLNNFKEDFSSSAFKTTDGERRIIGKFCEITILDDGTFDVWIITSNREPIGTRKLNNLEAAFSRLNGWQEAYYSRLTGEAIVQTTNAELLREIAFLAGVKRKRRVSEAVRQRCREQLANIRQEASA